jgi:hypothetical protein
MNIELLPSPESNPFPCLHFKVGAFHILLDADLIANSPNPYELIVAEIKLALGDKL